MEMLSCWPPEPEDPPVTGDNLQQLPSSGLQSPNIKRNDSLQQTPGKTTQKRTFDEVAKSEETETSEALFNKMQCQGHRDEAFANIALARWWRANSKYHLVSEIPRNLSSNPNTQLRHITKLPEAQKFLQTQIKRLAHCVETREATSHTRAVLATFLEKVGRLEEAKDHMEAAVTTCPEDKEYRWLRHRIQTKLKVNTIQTATLTQLEDQDLSQLRLPASLPVTRRSARGLSVSQFKSEFSATSTPVVITDLVHSMTSVPWTIAHIKEVAGGGRVKLRKLVPGSVDWAQLEDAGQTTVADFIDSLAHQESLPTHEQTYLFDWSIPLHCPDLAQEITTPDYFSGNLLIQTPPRSLYHDSWPSLFIAPKGLRSELHVDAFGSNFWMALFEGRKRWVFFKKEALALLYPQFESDQSTDPVFDINLRNPDLRKHPLLSVATPMECVLQPGELLFVPAGCPHYVENLEQSLAISSNFVDESNWELARGELEVNGLLDSRSEQLLEILKNIRDEGLM